jgi:hypothetical protein
MFRFKFLYILLITLFFNSQAIYGVVSTGFGAFGNNKVVISGDASLDSYDSQLGPYGGINVSSEGDVGSNGEIHLMGNLVVNGNVISGPGQQVIILGNVQVTGSTNPAMESVILDTVDSFVPGFTDLLKSEMEVDTLRDGIYRFDEVEVSGDGQLFLIGNVRIECAKFEISDSSMVVVEGTAEIYCSEKFVVSGESIFNAQEVMGTSITTNATVFVKGSEAVAEFSGRGHFYGTLNAPGEVVEVSGRSEIFGSIVGSEVEISGQGKLHFDEALGQ